MRKANVLFRGAGWRLRDPLALRAPERVVEVAADDPDGLGEALAFLDAVASSRDPGLLAAGFLTYEAGVALEGSAGVFRPPEATPLAWFGLFRVDGESAGGLDGETRAASPAGGGADGRPLDASGHAAAVAEIREAIARGDVYQVNLTRRIRRRGAAEPFRLAAALHDDNPVPFAVTIATEGWAVVSNSPELFLSVDLAGGRAFSSPIKGTARRLAGPEDAAAAAALERSEKDLAEHVMIVDLVRNDLGRVSVPGGVGVPSFRVVRSFRHLHHLESTVEGRLASGTRLSDVLAATLPAGSITGAPKRASLRFIRALEPEPRGPYTGAAGYVRGDGTAVFNVAIRTAVVSPRGVDYHTGGGIVWDSDPSSEWEETETKALEFLAAAEALGVAGGGDT